MNGLAKGMDYRHSNIQGCINDTAAAVRQDASTFSGDIAQWPSAEQLATWATDGTQLDYFENIYKSQTNEAMVKDYTDTSTYNLELIKNAYNNIKK